MRELPTVIIFILLSIGCTQHLGGDVPPLMPVRIFESNTTVTSEADVLAIFNQEVDTFINMSIEVEFFYIDRNCRYLSPNNTQVDYIPLYDYLTVRYEPWNYSRYWMWDGNESQYKVKIPTVIPDDNWKYRDNKVMVSYMECHSDQPAHSWIINNESDCPTYWEEKWREAYNFYYIVDSNGTVYFAGTPYC